MNIRRLSTCQQKALTKLKNCGGWVTPYDTGLSIATLDALVSRGLVEHKRESLGAMFSPRTANAYRYKHD